MPIMQTRALALASILAVSVHGQGILPGQPQSNTFNASFSDPPWSSVQERVRASSLDPASQEGVLTAFGFERSNWAGESTLSDFYRALPANASAAAPGDLLKLELVTNTSLYTLPPNVALSRFLFQTTNLNGTAVPASAYILWPWAPRRFGDDDDDNDNDTRLPVVAWAHGTSGWAAQCAPSHIRNLWYQYSAPYALALQGYAVVAPDYAGLGVGADAHGQPVRHQYLASTAAANDLVYAVQAAQTAFPHDLRSDFVVVGHSQGGGAAWAAAQRQATTPVAGYLGAVAGSPVVTPLVRAGAAEVWPLVAQGLDSVWPEFDARDWLSAAGVERLALLHDLDGCQSVKAELGYNFSSAQWLGPDFNASFYWNAYVDLNVVGGLPIGPEPLLVLHGTEDAVLPVLFTDTAVNETCRAYPDSNIHYARFEGVDHVPVMYAAQRLWLDFVEQLFANATASSSKTRKREQPGCVTTQHAPYFDAPRYQKALAYFLQFPLYAYETA